MSSSVVLSILDTIGFISLNLFSFTSLTPLKGKNYVTNLNPFVNCPDEYNSQCIILSIAQAVFLSLQILNLSVISYTFVLNNGTTPWQDLIDFVVSKPNRSRIKTKLKLDYTLLYLLLCPFMPAIFYFTNANTNTHTNSKTNREKNKSNNNINTKSTHSNNYKSLHYNYNYSTNYSNFVSHFAFLIQVLFQSFTNCLVQSLFIIEFEFENNNNYNYNYNLLILILRLVSLFISFIFCLIEFKIVLKLYFQYIDYQFEIFNLFCIGIDVITFITPIYWLFSIKNDNYNINNNNNINNNTYQSINIWLISSCITFIFYIPLPVTCLILKFIVGDIITKILFNCKYIFFSQLQYQRLDSVGVVFMLAGLIRIVLTIILMCFGISCAVIIGVPLIIPIAVFICLLFHGANLFWINLFMYDSCLARFNSFNSNNGINSNDNKNCHGNFKMSGKIVKQFLESVDGEYCFVEKKKNSDFGDDDNDDDRVTYFDNNNYNYNYNYNYDYNNVKLEEMETKLKVFSINYAFCLSCQKRVVNHDSSLHSFLLKNIKQQHLKMFQNDFNYNYNSNYDYDCNTFDYYMLEDVEYYDLRANTS